MMSHKTDLSKTWKLDPRSTFASRAARAQEIARELLLSIDHRTFALLVVPLVAFLPAQLAYGVALFRSDMRYRLSGSYPNQIKYSMKYLFGDRLNAIQLDHAARDYFRSESCATIDAMRMLGGGKSLLGLVEVRGLEHLNAALAGRRGAILCGAHLGSYKSLFSLVGALGFPVTEVARWSYSNEPETTLGRLLYRLERDYPVRSHLSRPIIEHRPGNYGTAVRAAKTLLQNGFVGIMIDAEPKPGDPSKPMVFSFLGRRANLVPGATVIAQLIGAPAIVVLLYRSADWRHQILEISPPIYVEKDPLVAFRQCLTLVEAAILRHPSQWQFLAALQLVRLGLLPREEALAIRRKSRADREPVDDSPA